MTPPMVGSDRARDCVPLALTLVGAVRDDDNALVQQVLDEADPASLAVILAAMVDDTRRPSDLLAWAQPDPDLDGWTMSAVLAAHRTYEQHRVRGELDLLSSKVREGQRLYDRRASRLRRKRQREASSALALVAS